MCDILYPTDGTSQPTIGIDVSKRTLDIAGTTRSTTSIPNTEAACRKFVRQLRKVAPRIVAVEATGGYERVLVELLWDNDIPVAILQPSRVRAHARSSGQLAKSDGIDKEMIRDFALSKRVRLTRRPAPEAEALRVLRDRREQVVQDRVREMTRLEAVRDRSMQREIKRHIKYLEKVEHDLDQRIAHLIASTESLKSKSDVLRSTLGIGPTITATLLCLLPELGLVNRQEIAALAGLAPYANESGAWKGKRSIFGGRKEVRRALYLAARTAARYDGPIRDRYQRMIAAGKCSKVAAIACARTILVGLNARMAEHLGERPAPNPEIHSLIT